MKTTHKTIAHYSQKAYYPYGATPIHEVMDWCAVRRLIRDRKNGAKIPPVLIDGALNQGNLLAGTHRMAANDLIRELGIKCEPIDWVDIDDIEIPEDMQWAIDALDFGAINDWWDGLDGEPGESIKYID